MIEDHLWFWGTALFSIALTVLAIMWARKKKNKFIVPLLIINLIWGFIDWDWYTNLAPTCYLFFSGIRTGLEFLGKKVYHKVKKSKSASQ